MPGLVHESQKPARASLDWQLLIEPKKCLSWGGGGRKQGLKLSPSRWFCLAKILRTHSDRGWFPTILLETSLHTCQHINTPHNQVVFHIAGKEAARDGRRYNSGDKRPGTLVRGGLRAGEISGAKKPYYHQLDDIDLFRGRKWCTRLDVTTYSPNRLQLGSQSPPCVRTRW